MTDREKVIKGMELLKDFIGDGLLGKSVVFNSCIGIVNDAITLLKAQEEDSKKIIEKGNVYECPWCGEEVFSDTNPNYCGYCGKPVKWE